MNNGASRSRCTIIQLREHPIFFGLVLAFNFSGVCLIIRFETSSVFFLIFYFFKRSLRLKWNNKLTFTIFFPPNN